MVPNSFPIYSPNDQLCVVVPTAVIYYRNAHTWSLRFLKSFLCCLTLVFSVIPSSKLERSSLHPLSTVTRYLLSYWPSTASLIKTKITTATEDQTDCSNLNQPSHQRMTECQDQQKISTCGKRSYILCINCFVYLLFSTGKVSILDIVMTM